MSMSNEITVVRSAIEKMEPQFKAALPPQVSPERFVRVTMTAIQNAPALMECERNSLYGAAMRAAQDGLLPDGREGAIVKYGNKAQWLPMVAGIMKKVRNSGEISTWSVHAVYENDEFEYQLGDEEKIHHKPTMRNRGEVIAFYSIVVMKDGEKSREVMTKDEVDSIRKRSRSKDSGPWQTDYDEMGKKTVIRRHAKRLPMSTDLDGVVGRETDDFEDVPNAPNVQEKPAKEGPKRPRGLQAVVDAVPDADGVIDVSSTEVEPMPEDMYESPI
jgi:recombination protein RecT